MAKENNLTLKIIGVLCLVACGVGLLYYLLSPSSASNSDTTEKAPAELSQEKETNKTQASAGDNVPDANDSSSELKSGESPSKAKEILPIVLVMGLVIIIECKKFLSQLPRMCRVSHM